VIIRRGAYSARPYDEADVSEAIAGGRRDVRPCDRQEAIRRLLARGDKTPKEIAQLLHISTRTVHRAAARLRNPESPAEPAAPESTAGPKPAKPLPSAAERDLAIARGEVARLARRLSHVDPFRSPVTHAKLTEALAKVKADVAALSSAKEAA
jgi:hypothetical protein